MNTMDVSNKIIQNFADKRKICYLEPRDGRGKMEPNNKISQERVDVVKKHINSFPR